MPPACLSIRSSLEWRTHSRTGAQGTLKTSRGWASEASVFRFPLREQGGKSIPQGARLGRVGIMQSKHFLPFCFTLSHLNFWGTRIKNTGAELKQNVIQHFHTEDGQNKATVMVSAHSQHYCQGQGGVGIHLPAASSALLGGLWEALQISKHLFF